MELRKVNHDDGNAVGGDVLPPAAVHPVEAGLGRHPAAVDVVHAGQRDVGRGTDDLQVDGVAIGLRDELHRCHLEAARRGLVAEILEGSKCFPPGNRFGRVGLGDQLLPARHVRERDARDDFEDAAEAGVQAEVCRDVHGHGLIRP